MTNQTLVSDRPVQLSSAATAVQAPQTTASSATVNYQTRLLEAMKAQYQLDQQVKFLHLQAETESLFQQLQAIKQRRQASMEATANQPH